MTQEERQEKLSYIVRELFKQYQEYVSKLDVSDFTVGDTPDDIRAHYKSEELYAVGEVMLTFYINEYESDFLKGFTDEQLELLYTDISRYKEHTRSILPHLAEKFSKQNLKTDNYCNYSWVFKPYSESVII